MTMEPITVKKVIPFDSKIAGDIAITAAEGGIGYWSVIDSYHPSRWTEWDDSLGNIEVADDFVFYTIRYEDPIFDGRATMDITPELIRHGIQVALDMGLRSDLLAQLSDPLDEMDSEAADCVIQCGAFGEVVFG